MSSNRRNHLEFDLACKRKEAQRLEREADLLETSWHRAAENRKFCEELHQELLRVEDERREEFRGSHSKLCREKTQIGEIEGELFRFGEDERDWYHQ